MRPIAFVVLFIAFLSAAPWVSAQEGHPLKGAWFGDWGPSRNDRNPVLIF